MANSVAIWCLLATIFLVKTAERLLSIQNAKLNIEHGVNIVKITTMKVAVLGMQIQYKLQNSADFQNCSDKRCQCQNDICVTRFTYTLVYTYVCMHKNIQRNFVRNFFQVFLPLPNSLHTCMCICMHLYSYFSQHYASVIVTSHNNNK